MQTAKAVAVKLPLSLAQLLAEAAKLANPVLAASLVATVVEIISPFGLHVGSDAAAVTGVLTAVGALAEAVRRLVAK